ncbi:hypothetical protein F53441_7316 [Fusarium austroafricanum]|uniref:Uncharacterized protein n=1 Tax=Fusarium austroafricanum TaxID=2364996 RepID=A0A8H4KHV9_9HYPO|nr:hypothetical protein F53441_7316 [Fusarium austroafricanum]
MPPQTRKRKASAMESDEEEAAPRKTARATRKPATKTANQRKGESDRRMAASGAKTQIKKQGCDLSKSIDGEIKTRCPRIDSDVLTKDLSPDLAAILPWMDFPPAQQKDAQSYPKMVLKALDDLHTHIDTYEKLVRQDTKIKAPNWMRWEQDVKDLEEMSKHSLTSASRIINHVIMPDLHELPTKPPESATGVENVAWELIEEALPDMSDDIWGKVAQGHLKAFTEILKVLPVEESF